MSLATWFQGMIAAIVGGASTAGLSWMSLGAAKAAGIDVPVLNWKALGMILVIGGLTNLLSFLRQSPVPTHITTLTVTKETTDPKGTL